MTPKPHKVMKKIEFDLKNLQDEFKYLYIQKNTTNMKDVPQDFFFVRLEYMTYTINKLIEGHNEVVEYLEWLQRHGTLPRKNK